MSRWVAHLLPTFTTEEKRWEKGEREERNIKGRGEKGKPEAAKDRDKKSNPEPGFQTQVHHSVTADTPGQQ